MLTQHVSPRILLFSFIILWLNVETLAFVISNQYYAVQSLGSKRMGLSCSSRFSRPSKGHILRCSVETAALNKRWPNSLIERKLSAHYPTPQSEVPPKKLDVPGPFERAIKKPAGTMAIIGSIKRSDPSIEKLINGFKSANEISAALHDAKVAAIACWTDPELLVSILSASDSYTD